MRGILFSDKGHKICWRSWGVGCFMAYANLALLYMLGSGGPASFLLFLLFAAASKIVYSYRPYAKPDIRPSGSDPS